MCPVTKHIIIAALTSQAVQMPLIDVWILIGGTFVAPAKLKMRHHFIRLVHIGVKSIFRLSPTLHRLRLLLANPSYFALDPQPPLHFWMLLFVFRWDWSYQSV